jgi:5-methylcytosine-specific restriction enzyme A
MPRLSLCSYPGCRTVTTTGRCTDHQSQRSRQYRKIRDPFLDSQAWRHLSTAVARMHPHCAECERHGRITIGTQRDHVIPRKERPDLALDAANIENLCDRCHARKTRRGE